MLSDIFSMRYTQLHRSDGTCVPRINADALARTTPTDLTLALRAHCGDGAIKFLEQRLAAPGLASGDEGFGIAQFPVPQDIRDDLKQILSDLGDWLTGALPWDDDMRGILLYGPPGCGKIEIARVLSRDAGIRMFATSLANWQSRSSRGSDIVREMQEFFKNAVQNAPCLVFIEELDSLGSRTRKPDHNSAYTDIIVGGLLEAMDGFTQREGVVILGTTNHINAVDPALRRPGRFDKLMYLPNPAADLPPVAFRWHLRDDLRQADLSQLASLAVGMSGAEIAAVVRQARACARRQKRALEISDLDAVITAHRPPFTDAHRWQIAVHEAGHAIAGIVTNHLTPVLLSITPTAGGPPNQGHPLADIRTIWKLD